MTIRLSGFSAERYAMTVRVIEIDTDSNCDYKGFAAKCRDLLPMGSQLKADFN